MKILVVDDHPLILEASRQVLKVLDPQLTVLEALNCEDALGIAREHADLDLVLLDLSLPGTNGMDALGQFRTLHEGIPVVVLSAYDDHDTVMRALDTGAMGFIPKTSPNKVLLSALRLVLSGGVYLPPGVLVHASGQSTRPEPAGMPRPAPGSSGTLSPQDVGLTQRQAEVLALLVQGKPNKLICRDLGLSEGTVKVHVTAILKTLSVANRTQAVIAVGHLGLKLPTPAAASR